MSPRRSAGILLFRHGGDGVEVLLAHMGGPYWRRREVGAWTLPKGEPEEGEAPLDAARREFREELGVAPPDGEPVDLGEVRQAGGKVVTAWGLEGDLDPTAIRPGTFELEWPPGSGRRQAFPEVDRVAWFTVDEARGLVVSAQREFLDRLLSRVRG